MSWQTILGHVFSAMSQHTLGNGKSPRVVIDDGKRLRHKFACGRSPYSPFPTPVAKIKVDLKFQGGSGERFG